MKILVVIQLQVLSFIHIVYSVYVLQNVPILYMYCKMAWYLKISLSQLVNPAYRRFFSVAFLWYSLLPVNRKILKPSCLSSLYKLKLAGNAGASAKSTQESKDSSSKVSDLHRKQDFVISLFYKSSNCTIQSITQSIDVT